MHGRASPNKRIGLRSAQVLPGSPQFARPLPVHAGPLDQQEECSATDKHAGQDHECLNPIVHPEIVSNAQRRRQVPHGGNYQDVKQVNAVTHPPNVSNYAVAEDDREYLPSKGRKIENDDKKRHQNMAKVTRQRRPYQRPPTECENVPQKGGLPIFAGQVQIANQKPSQKERQVIDNGCAQMKIAVRGGAQQA